MTRKVRILRSTVPGRRPTGTVVQGQLYINFADQQLGVGNPKSDGSTGTMDLLPIRFFSSLATYVKDDLVLQNGLLYKASKVLPAGTFNPGDWVVVGPDTNLSLTSAVDSVTVTNSSGANAMIPATTSSKAGVMSVAQLTALNKAVVDITKNATLITELETSQDNILALIGDIETDYMLLSDRIEVLETKASVPPPIKINVTTSMGVIYDDGTVAVVGNNAVAIDTGVTSFHMVVQGPLDTSKANLQEHNFTVTNLPAGMKLRNVVTSFQRGTGGWTLLRDTGAVAALDTTTMKVTTTPNVVLGPTNRTAIKSILYFGN